MAMIMISIISIAMVWHHSTYRDPKSQGSGGATAARTTYAIPHTTSLTQTLSRKGGCLSGYRQIAKYTSAANAIHTASRDGLGFSLVDVG